MLPAAARAPMRLPHFIAATGRGVRAGGDWAPLKKRTSPKDGGKHSSPATQRSNLEKELEWLRQQNEQLESEVAQAKRESEDRRSASPIHMYDLSTAVKK